MNKVQLIGRVGQVPEVKDFKNVTVAKFSLATSESYKKDGEKITETTWHNLVFFGKQCETLKKYVNKGDQLYVEGKIVIRKYDKDGATHWTTEIVCNGFELLGNKKETETKEPEKKSTAMSDISELPGAEESAENDPSYFPE